MASAGPSCRQSKPVTYPSGQICYQSTRLVHPPFPPPSPPPQGGEGWGGGAETVIFRYTSALIQGRRMAMPVPRNATEDDITAEVLQRFAETPDPRLRQIML